MKSYPPTGVGTHGGTLQRAVFSAAMRIVFGQSKKIRDTVYVNAS